MAPRDGPSPCDGCKARKTKCFPPQKMVACQACAYSQSRGPCTYGGLLAGLGSAADTVRPASRSSAPCPSAPTLSRNTTVQAQSTNYYPPPSHSQNDSSPNDDGMSGIDDSTDMPQPASQPQDEMNQLLSQLFSPVIYELPPEYAYVYNMYPYHDPQGIHPIGTDEYQNGCSANWFYWFPVKTRHTEDHWWILPPILPVTYPPVAPAFPEIAHFATGRVPLIRSDVMSRTCKRLAPSRPGSLGTHFLICRRVRWFEITYDFELPVTGKYEITLLFFIVDRKLLPGHKSAVVGLSNSIDSWQLPKEPLAGQGVMPTIERIDVYLGAPTTRREQDERWVRELARSKISTVPRPAHGVIKRPKDERGSEAEFPKAKWLEIKVEEHGKPANYTTTEINRKCRLLLFSGTSEHLGGPDPPFLGGFKFGGVRLTKVD